jgi:N-acetyl-anhydromuramyl-L-alanine amidase AmpD
MPQITWIGSPNFDTGRSGHTVKAIVLHGTGTPGTLQPGIGDVDSTFAQDGGVSTHFAVDRNGNIHQYVKTSDVAYGNGIVDSVGPDPSVGWLVDNWHKNVNPNLETISIETKNDSSNAQPLTEVQYQAVLWLVCQLLTQNPQIPLDRHSGILGHYQIQQQGRARCPGPNFPWDRLMADLKTANIPQNGGVSSVNSQTFSSVNLLTNQPAQIAVNAPFLDFWKKYGGLTVFGLPVTPELPAAQLGLSFAGSVQYFERARFEWHDQEKMVMLGRVGAELLQASAKK